MQIQLAFFDVQALFTLYRVAFRAHTSSLSYPIWFSCWCKSHPFSCERSLDSVSCLRQSYAVQCDHSLSFDGATCPGVVTEIALFQHCTRMIYLIYSRKQGYLNILRNTIVQFKHLRVLCPPKVIRLMLFLILYCIIF